MELNESSCALGLENRAEIKRTNERMELLMERLEDKIDRLSNKLDSLEKKLDSSNSSLDDRIDRRIKENAQASIYSLIRWLVVVAGGSIFITLVSRFILASI